MPTSNSLLKLKYNELNNSFKKKIVYRIGSEAGFFSEYNNMVFAILYCLQNKIKFTLSSKHANFAEDGWEDFFLSFCPENLDEFHLHFNNRIHSKLRLKSRLKRIFINFFLNTYLTQDIWLKFRSSSFAKSQFDIEKLFVKGNLLEASKEIVKMTWNYNERVQRAITEKIENLKLPASYLSVHIRRGDKINEINHSENEDYITKLSMFSKIKDVFISTDDYSSILYLKNKYPDYNFLHLNNTMDSGYDQRKFIHLSNEQKREELIQLFSSIEIMTKSKYLICTFTSNVGLYLAMRRGKTKTYDVNDRKWQIW